MCLLSSDWKCNAELYLEASESAPPMGPWWSWDRDMSTSGTMTLCCGCPVGKTICFLEEGSFELSLAGRGIVSSESRGRMFRAEG